MKAAIIWVARRTALYALVAVIATTIGGYLYSASTGTDVIAGSGWSASNLIAWLNVGAGVAVIGAGIALVLLALVAPLRNRLKAFQIKLLLLPLFLLPVLFVDLGGSSPYLTLDLAAMQICYLIIVPMATGSR